MNFNSPATYLQYNQDKLDNECNALGFHFDMTRFMRAADELSLTKNTTGNNTSRPWYVTVNGHRFEKKQVHFQLASKMLSYEDEEEQNEKSSSLFSDLDFDDKEGVDLEDYNGAAVIDDDSDNDNDSFDISQSDDDEDTNERQVHEAEEFMSVEAAVLLLLRLKKEANGTRGTRGVKRARGCNELNVSIQELLRSIQELIRSIQELIRSNQELIRSNQERDKTIQRDHANARTGPPHD